MPETGHVISILVIGWAIEVVLGTLVLIFLAVQWLRTVRYPDGECHPRAYADWDGVVSGDSKAAAQRNVERWRIEHPRWIFDFNMAAGRVVYRRVRKRWWER